MKLQYLATLATASLLTITSNIFVATSSVASSLQNNESSVLVAENPCAAQNPCAANPCASNPCASNPCAASANPCAANPCAANPCAAKNPCAARQVETGRFTPVNSRNNTEGTFTIVEVNGRQYIRFSDDFQVSQGPDLEIILHKKSVVPASIAEKDYVSLAPIQRFSGSQLYAVPENVDVQDYASVAVWCEEFNVTFGYGKI